jgi:signal transduction histidine kinase/ActR/RegA family two-component response regulator
MSNPKKPAFSFAMIDDSLAQPSCALQDVLITDQLALRHSRLPDYRAEAEALGALGAAMTADPRELLRRLADTAMALCGGESAGVSILERGGSEEIFRWHAIVGRLANHAGGTLPREDSPCDAVLSLNTVLVLHRPARHFSVLRGMEPPIHESLMVPWDLDGKPAGTLWVISHSPDRDFDAEDARLLTTLARFAAAAWQQALVVQAAEAARDAVSERTGQLVHSQQRLRALASELNLAEQRERKRLAAELHDHLQQILVLGKLKLGQGKRLANQVPACVGMLNQVDDVLTEALGYTRTLVTELSPPVLRHHGLAAGLKWLAEYMHKHDMNVTVTVPEENQPRLPEDQTVLLFQSVRELLMNAWKYAKTGKALVRLEQRAGELRIDVRDEGVGFDVSTDAPLEEASHGVSSKFGLFSIRERMIALGGSFELASAPGRGTTATLILPLETREDEATAETPDPSRSMIPLREHTQAHSRTEPASRLRVLLVDDHAMVRQGLKSVLEGYSDVEVVGEAGSGQEAVALAEQLRPAVVVMDINMPQMNGIDATRAIRTRYADMIVVGLSVNAGEDNRDAMMAAGAAVLMTKEAAVEQLYSTIQDALQGRTQRPT